MSTGQPVPPRLVEAFALNAPAGSGAGDKTAPFPAASQIGITPGAASLADGFPPLTMTAPTAGGIPPSGADMNGILYVLSSWAAFFAAGQIPGYDATLQTAMGGYAKGAVLQQAANTNGFWISTTAGNMTDPDTGGAGWISTVPLFHADAPSAGTHNDVVLAGPSDYVVEIDTTAGATTVTGFVAQRDGQRRTIVNIGANSYTLAALTGSAAANQILLPTNIVLLQNMSYTLQYCAGAAGGGKWVPA